MPNRIAPPAPQTPFEQYVIDRIEHLDECLDDTKTSMQKGFTAARGDHNEIRATLEAWMIAGKQADSDLAEEWRKHYQFHVDGEKAAAVRKSVWQMQAAVVGKVLKYASEGAGLAVVVYALKQLGLL